MNNYMNNNMNNSTVITRGKIIMVDLPMSNNSIQGGLRPCLVVSNNKGNQYSPVLIVVPITSRQTKKPMPTHFHIEPSLMNGLTKKSIALAEQIITIGKEMVVDVIGELNLSEMNLFNNKLKKSLNLF